TGRDAATLAGTERHTGREQDGEPADAHASPPCLARVGEMVRVFGGRGQEGIAAALTAESLPPASRAALFPQAARKVESSGGEVSRTLGVFQLRGGPWLRSYA